MQNFIFYTLTVLIWGSTWIGIKFQLGGSVAPIISVAYRFTLAATLLMLWCFMRNLKMRFSLKDHLFMALQGTFLFALNYWLFYVAELYITSGLAAVIFSTIVIMNMVNGAIFLKSPFNNKVIVGGIFGLCGIILVFKPEFHAFHLGDKATMGILASFAATLLASLGNIISARNQKHGLPIIQTNAWGMSYGALLILIIAVMSGQPFTLDISVRYIGALIYLALFGSIVAFGCYLTLIGKIGADRAAYATLLFPIVALIISTIWEGYHWSSEAVIGVGLILTGNLLMLKKIPAEDLINRVKSGISRLTKSPTVATKSTR